MSSFKYYWKITRPVQVIMGGFAAWVVSLISNGPLWITPEKITAGAVMALSVLSASVWHYGARHDVYARKHWCMIIVRNPPKLVFFGAIGFLTSIVLAGIFLGGKCMMIALLNAIVIGLYARRLDQYWPWKNLVIAGICVTPLVLGWFSGHRLHPMVPPMICAAFLIYLTREILKDVIDREANQGKRFTMVMELGINSSIKIAGGVLLLSILFIYQSLLLMPPIQSIKLLYGVGGLFLAIFALALLSGKDLSKKYLWIDAGVILMLVCLLFVRINMY